MKKLKIALLGIVSLLVIIMLLPTKIQNPVEGCLSEIDTHIGAIVTKNSVIGKVGNTGNAAGKPHHLHYSISRFHKVIGVGNPSKSYSILIRLKNLKSNMRRKTKWALALAPIRDA